MGRQRQLPVYDNTEVASGVRDGEASAEQQDVVAVDPVYKLTRAEPLQLCLRRVQPKSARTQPGVDVRHICSEHARGTSSTDVSHRLNGVLMDVSTRPAGAYITDLCLPRLSCRRLVASRLT